MTAPTHRASTRSSTRSSVRAFAAGVAVTTVLGGGLLALGGAGLPSASAGQKGINADLIDGFDGSQLALTRGRTGPYTSDTVELVDIDKDGTDDYARATATCPKGTKVTGGGFFNPLDYPIAQSVMYEPRQWQVWTTDLDAASGANPEQLFAANATCYNPRNRVPVDPTSPELRAPGR